MTSIIDKIFFPGVAPALLAKCLKLPIPETVKKVLAHPAGPFTIHFWAPLFKWALSIANIMDISRPVEKMSLGQQTAVALTGMIWSRYSLVIVPVNYSLFSVNMAMGLTGSYQLSRILKFKYDQSIKKNAQTKTNPN
eukprot:Platyproteum_vivax@DN13230_c0_g1_i1.p1